MPYNALSKFQIVQGPLQFQPHNCSGCSRYQEVDGSELEFIEWGFEVDFFGKVYICKACITQMAVQFGMHSNEEFADVMLKKSAAEMTALNNGNELRKYKNAVASLGDVGVIVPVFDVSGTRITAAPENEPIPAAKPVRKSGSTKSGSTKQTNEPGRSNVPNDESLDGFIAELEI